MSVFKDCECSLCTTRDNSCGCGTLWRNSKSGLVLFTVPQWGRRLCSSRVFFQRNDSAPHLHTFDSHFPTRLMSGPIPPVPLYFMSKLGQRCHWGNRPSFMLVWLNTECFDPAGWLTLEGSCKTAPSTNASEWRAFLRTKLIPSLRIRFLWDMTPCQWVNWISTFQGNTCSRMSSTFRPLKMKTICRLETSELDYTLTQHHIMKRTAVENLRKRICQFVTSNRSVVNNVLICSVIQTNQSNKHSVKGAQSMC